MAALEALNKGKPVELTKSDDTPPSPKTGKELCTIFEEP